MEMEKSIKKFTGLVVKGAGLSKVKGSYKKTVNAENSKIADDINAHRIEEGKSIERARSFVTNS